jgi:hypothetical protein
LPEGAAHRRGQPPKSGAYDKKDKEIGHAAGLAPVGKGINSRDVEHRDRNANGRLQVSPVPPAS